MPQVYPVGNKVYVEPIGGHRSIIACASHEAAIAKAVEVEAEMQADREARDALYAKYDEQGVPMVRKAPRPEPETPADPGETLNPAVTLPVSPEEFYDKLVAPAVADTEPPSGEPAGGESDGVVTIDSRTFDSAAGRLVVEITASAATQMWRRVGERESSFEAKPGTSVRRWGAKPGDKVEVRLGDADGELLLQLTVEDQPTED